MKRFIVKVYQKDWTFKKTIAENKIMSDISFDMQKNWWQWQLDILINENFNNTDVLKADFIKVFLYDHNFPNWKLIYTWIVEEINRNYKETENTVEIIARWLSSLLTRIYYNQSWYTFTKTDTASNIIKSIITYFNAVYPWNWLNTDWMINTAWDITIDFDFDNCFDAINKIQEIYWSYWFIDETWTVYLKPKSLFLKDMTAPLNTYTDPLNTYNWERTIIYLTAWKDVQNIDINEDWSEIVNRVIVEYDGWTHIDEDTSSIANNWLFEKKYLKTDLWLSEAQDFATEILANNQTKQAVSIEINNKYIFENLKPWYKIKVRNINYLINSTIEKINYNTNNAIVYLDKFNSIWKII